jgi:hypothetical protein
VNENQRGKDAARLLEDPILKAAFEEIEKYQISRWRSSVDDEKGWDIREDAHGVLKGLDAFRNQLLSFVTTGKIAETKSNRRKE